MSDKSCAGIKTLILAASNRRGSLNHRLGELAVRAVQKTGADAELYSLSDFPCPFYDGDLEKEEGLPQGALQFGSALKDVDAFLILSPEYNASIPGELKNLIDWTSRIRPQPFNGRQAMLMSASPSMVGGNRGLWSLRIPLEHLGARVYPDMFSLAQAHKAFREDGSLSDETLQKRFDDTVGCFLDLVEAAKHFPAVKKQWIEFLGEHPDVAIDRVETSEANAA